MDGEILKPKTSEEIKKDFDTFFKELFGESAELNLSKAFDLISGIIKLVPDIEKQNFARAIINEIAIWSSNNGYDALGILEFSKDDLMRNFKELEDEE